MRLLTADWLFPLNGPPLAQGVVAVADNGRIEAILNRQETDPLLLEYHEGALCPGFVNAHCHLELSHLHGSIPPGTGLKDFLLSISQRRGGPQQLAQPEIQEAMQRADQAMFQAGIVAVADISNTNVSLPVKSRSSILYHTFVECLGLNPDQIPQRLAAARRVLQLARDCKQSASLAPHAPYTVCKALLQEIMTEAAAVYSVHFLESEAERQLLMQGSGPLTELLPLLQVSEHYFRTHAPQWPEVLLQLLPAGSNLLLVHNTVAEEADLSRLQHHSDRIYLCTCPNANRYIEHRLPDYLTWRRFTDRICVGTDSLASNQTLSVLSELRTIQDHVPDIELNELLHWACRNGARCMGWTDLGTLEPGKRPGVVHIAPLEVQIPRLVPESQALRIA